MEGNAVLALHVAILFCQGQVYKYEKIKLSSKLHESRDHAFFSPLPAPNTSLAPGRQEYLSCNVTELK